MAAFQIAGQRKFPDRMYRSILLDVGLGEITDRIHHPHMGNKLGLLNISDRFVQFLEGFAYF